MIRSSALVLGLAALLLVPRGAFAQDNDALDPLRERFKAGMESYQAGRYGDAGNAQGPAPGAPQQ